MISAAFIALGKSCLLANTSSTASRSSSCGTPRPAVSEGSFRAAGPGPIGGVRGARQATGPAADAPHLVEHAVQLIPGLAYAVAVVAVHHEDQALRVLEVVPPQRPDLRATGRGAHRPARCRSLASAATTRLRAPTLSWPPTSHTVKLMFLYSTVSTLKPGGTRAGPRSRLLANPSARRALPQARRSGRTDSGDGCDNLAQLQLIQNRSLTSCVQTDLRAVPIRRRSAPAESWLDNHAARGPADASAAPLEAAAAAARRERAAHHENPHLLLAEQPRKQLGESQPHLGWLCAPTGNL